ncbi:unnamed protein product [Lampetra fluviatilis]
MAFTGSSTTTTDGQGIATDALRRLIVPLRLPPLRYKSRDRVVGRAETLPACHQWRGSIIIMIIITLARKDSQISQDSRYLRKKWDVSEKPRTM